MLMAQQNAATARYAGATLLSSGSTGMAVDAPSTRRYPAPDLSNGKGSEPDVFEFAGNSRCAEVDSETFYREGFPDEEDLPVDFEIESTRVWRKD